MDLFNNRAGRLIAKETMHAYDADHSISKCYSIYTHCLLASGDKVLLIVTHRTWIFLYFEIRIN